MAKKINYLSNKILLPLVIRDKKRGELSNELAEKFMMLADKYLGSPQFRYYTYKDDMQAYALMQLCTSWKGFNPDRSNNPFAFYTQCIKNSFRQFLNMEKKHRDIRDALLVEEGMDPSFRYQEDKKK